MGCILGSFAATAACCFCSSACSLCCSCCPSCKNSTASRIGYAVLLFFSTVIAGLFMVPGLRSTLQKIPYLCYGDRAAKCDEIVGYLSVYRVMFAVAMFFVLMSIIMINVKSSKDPRSKFQNGFWFFKVLILVGICVGAFFIPSGNFGVAWMWIGMIGSFLFIIIQLILIVEFVHTWAENWMGKYEETEAKGWACCLLFFAIIFYSVSITAVVLFYIYYAHAAECTMHKAFVSVNLILVVIASVISILPRVRESLPSSGILQSSAITCYVMYLTWSAMTNYPSRACNPSVTNSTGTSDGQVYLWKDGHVNVAGIIGLLIWFLSVVYSSIRTSATSNMGKLTMSEKTILQKDTDAVDNGGADEENGGQHVWDNEEDGVAYHYSYFHLLLCFASLYVMMTLTGWYKPTSDFERLNANLPAVWVKISSSWICIALYIWTLIAPIVLTNRQF